MNCPIDHDQLMAFAAGILDPCEIEAIESHLEFCMECRNVVEQNRMLLQSITKEPVLAPTALESLALSKALSELAPEVHYRTVNESPKAGFWGFAAASIAVFVAIVLGSMTHCFERIGAILLQSPVNLIKASAILILIIFVTTFIPIVMTAKRKPLNGFTFTR